MIALGSVCHTIDAFARSVHEVALMRGGLNLTVNTRARSEPAAFVLIARPLQHTCVELTSFSLLSLLSLCVPASSLCLRMPQYHPSKAVKSLIKDSFTFRERTRPV